jgi:uncharacterized membrane protein
MERAAVALRVGLAVAYPWLAHAANARGDGLLAALALGDIALIVLLGPLLRPRAWAWAALAACVALLWALAHSAHPTLPLLLPPVLFLGLAAWVFARSLLPGRVPLIARIVAPLYGSAPADLAPALRRYTRGLTAAWALLLAGLGLANLALALFSVPGGLLARLGLQPPLAVPAVHGSLFANLLVYAVVAGFFLGEYAWRRRRFPQRPYRDLPDFLRRLAALGPGFWRDALR